MGEIRGTKEGEGIGDREGYAESEKRNRRKRGTIE